MFHVNRRMISGGVGLATLLGVMTLVAMINSPRPAGATLAVAPVPSAPSAGATLTGMAPQLDWSLPAGATQVHLQVTTANGDGPGVNLILNATSSFIVPAPLDWYGLLPDMTYDWKVRATDATTAVGEADASWGPWSTTTAFRTPKVDISSVSLYAPVGGQEVNSAQPVLTWASATADLYYWEVQVSQDAAFGSDSFLYWVLVHGDVSYPNNAYTIPASFPLDAGATYYWRVRPRVQGDGTELAWTSAASFKTPASGALTVNVLTPADESVVASSTLSVTGQTKPGAFVTVDDQFVTANASGDFTVTVTVTEGINLIDVIASDVSGAVVTTSLTVSYLPGGTGTLQDSRERGRDGRDLFRVHIGEVTEKGTADFELKDRNGRVATVLVDDKTRFLQPGKRGTVSFADLKVGMKVAVFGRRVRDDGSTPTPTPGPATCMA